jgi:hypothetical protein
MWWVPQFRIFFFQLSYRGVLRALNAGALLLWGKGMGGKRLINQKRL